MINKLQEFYNLDELQNASYIAIPPLLREWKEKHPLRFPISQLQSFGKDLRFVGYSLSYLDALPVLLQTRIIQNKDVMFAQLTLGVRAIEDIYGWNSRGKQVYLTKEFPLVRF